MSGGVTRSHAGHSLVGHGKEFGFYPRAMESDVISSAFCFLILSYLFLFGCAGSSLMLFSSCSKQGLLSSCGVQASHCGGFSCCRAWTPGHQRFSSCGSLPLEHRLNSCGAQA